jgi:hypothetical protein
VLWIFSSATLKELAITAGVAAMASETDVLRRARGRG